MISTVAYRGQGAPVFVERGRLCHGTMAQWPVQAWVTTTIGLRVDGCATAYQRSIRSQWSNPLAAVEPKSKMKNDTVVNISPIPSHPHEIHPHPIKSVVIYISADNLRVAYMYRRHKNSTLLRKKCTK